MVDFGMDPQKALDAPRFSLAGVDSVEGPSCVAHSKCAHTRAATQCKYTIWRHCCACIEGIVCSIKFFHLLIVLLARLWLGHRCEQPPARHAQCHLAHASSDPNNGARLCHSGFIPMEGYCCWPSSSLYWVQPIFASCTGSHMPCHATRPPFVTSQSLGHAGCCWKMVWMWRSQMHWKRWDMSCTDMSRAMRASCLDEARSSDGILRRACLLVVLTPEQTGKFLVGS